TLTLVSVVFIPLTFLVGVYGMNFDYMPELKWNEGYFALWGVMVTLTVAIVVYFKSKKWF
ncbi:MAG: CorA family divalent cation transporter, partial [Psychrobacter sp.]